MSDPLPAVIRADSQIECAVRPLVEQRSVIKSGVLRDLCDIDDELEDLRQQAIDRIEAAKEEADEIRKRAQKEGQADGHRECMEALAKARSEYGKLCNRAESDMVTLAFQIARRIVGHAIEVRPEVVRDIVGEALITARGRRQICVFVHPDDHEVVQAHRHEYAREFEGVTVYFEADPELARGDCMIETEAGRIDARLETQLEVLREALLRGGDPTRVLSSGPEKITPTEDN